MKKKVICLILLLVGYISSVIVINYLKPYKTSNSLIAVYYEDESGNYQKSKENKFYKEGYALDKEKSKCDNGSTINWNNETNKVEIKGTKTDKCNIYLSKKEYTLLTQNTEIKDKDAKLTNMIKNGSFEDGFNNWQYDINACEITDEYATHGNYSVKFNYHEGEDYTAMVLQYLDQDAPTYQHSYYGRIMFLSGEKFSVPYTDNGRFEWYAGDIYGINDLVFAYKAIKTTEWTLLSNTAKLVSDEYTSLRWIIRNFIRAGTDVAYTDELMAIDLTESYNDNIPTQDWLDKHLIYFDDSVDIKTTTGKDGIFEVNDTAGTFRCSEGGSGKIENGKVVITGTNVNTTCILE